MAGSDDLSEPSSGSKGMQVLLMLSLGAFYIVVSAGLIAFNKYLVNSDRFPFAIALVLCHSGFSSVMALFLFLVKPSLFPSLTCPEKKVSVDASLVLGKALPIAAVFSGQLVLSNTAYLHSSTAFLQMLKESNLVLVYFFSLLAALEVFNWVKLRVLLCIVGATFLAVKGELRFSLMGFAIQGTSQLFESSKIVLQAIILSNAGKKLDPMSYVLLVMPLCFVVLSGMICLLTFVYPLDMLRIPNFSDLLTWWPVLLANATVAFTLNVTIAVFIKHSSAVAFILAGITKDAVIVLAGGAFLGELVSKLQVFAFACQLVLIWLWSLMKLFPDKFEDGVFRGLYALAEATGEKNDASDKLVQKVQSTTSYQAAKEKV
mmetsp:Transcript_43779/g.82091  ORF Transcript_43779/g.82091 Transcript_43779/m.82091 type:complete len:374 (-) Transcript_43779:88-1209(-)